MPQKNWTLAEMPRLDDKVAVVTGANRGLGLEISAGLAGAGATVVMACRDPRKAQAGAAEVRRRVPQAKLEIMQLDLADLASVRQFAQDFKARFSRLDILCNNGSAIMVPLGKTRDGFETHIGTNHLGHFALTGLLLERLQATPGSRVVNTASMAHRLTKGLKLDDLHFERRPYKEMDAYGQSKLASLLYTFELDRRLRQSGSAVTAVAAHPGWSNTNPDQGSALMRWANSFMAQPAAMGALPSLYAATAPGVQGGEYFGPGGFKELRGYPAKVGSSDESRDPQLAAALWVRSEQLTGTKYL
ncbi:oxidoreductase [Nevskia soli]|uniref:oxidoreductase n=1 Tax=Nevskia soli TaxID=418856 RepID=UPI0004A75679|nr:oxidoreductase [Nevskia soli]